MAFGIGNLGKIVEDFKESLNQIFGSSGNSSSKSAKNLYRPEYGGATELRKENWLGNTQMTSKKPATLRYGFAIFDAGRLQVQNQKFDENSQEVYYLDIPPQAITQRELFSTNITSTRKGIIVESEGVVFKDIIISGTTGVFPGPRGGFNSARANISDITAPPKAPAGVNPDTGLSTRSNVKIISGFEEFLNLRQFFLRYASEKVKNNGNRFLIFINEKDSQALIVEPLEFTMDRSSKSPLTYNYKIVLKAIGTYNALFTQPAPADLSLLEKIGNVAANVTAGIGQVRGAINATSTLFQKTFQAIDQTVNGPLRQVQFALEDLSNGLSDTLSLPAILARNFTSTIAGIRENAGQIGTTLGFNNPANAREAAAQQSLQASVQSSIENDNRVPIPRAFVSDLKFTLKSQSEDLADAFNLGDPNYNVIKGRTVTNNPGPLKVVSDEEFLLLGNVQGLSDNLNQLLATNSAFQSDAEETFDQANQVFANANVPLEQFQIRKPEFVREVKILRGDTLEKIALREQGDALRWTEMVILNNLKPPYIDDNGGDGVKKPGENLLIGAD